MTRDEAIKRAILNVEIAEGGRGVHGSATEQYASVSLAWSAIAALLPEEKPEEQPVWQVGPPPVGVRVVDDKGCYWTGTLNTFDPDAGLCCLTTYPAHWRFAEEGS